MIWKIKWKDPVTGKWHVDTVEAVDIKAASNAALKRANGGAGGSFTVVST